MRLPHKPFLELVVTGGSSAVTPVKDCLLDGVLDGVKDVLLTGGIGAGIVDGTTVIQSYLAALKQGGYSETQILLSQECLHERRRSLGVRHCSKAGFSPASGWG